jgi:hypothetical protein
LVSYAGLPTVREDGGVSVGWECGYREMMHLTDIDGKVPDWGEEDF